VNKTNPVQDFSLLFNIILLPTPRFAKWSLSSMFNHQIPVCMYILPHT
jgi:hypothetical protein